jgi:hypothetical protein
MQEVAVTSTAENQEFVTAIIQELASGVDAAVECWMAEIESAVTDVHLTTLGRLNAVNEILDNYKHLTGKARLHGRRPVRRAIVKDHVWNSSTPTL